MRPALLGKWSSVAGAFFVGVIAGVFWLANAGQSGDCVSSEDEVPSIAIANGEFCGDIPQEWKMSGSIVGKGWNESGAIPMAFEDAVVEVNRIMKNHGYSVRHRVSDERNGGYALIQYEAGDGDKAMWMIWAMGALKSGFSWGIVR